jgi:hypothetical protein
LTLGIFKKCAAINNLAIPMTIANAACAQATAIMVP